MTVEEKRKIVNAYCEKTICSECKLKVGGWKKCIGAQPCLDIRLSPEEDLDRALMIIEGNPPEGSSEKDAFSFNDPVNRPSHYTDGKIEVIDFIEDKKLGFCLGNAIKYIARAGKKDPTKEIEDLKKAKWYVERRIKELEECKE